MYLIPIFTFFLSILLVFTFYYFIKKYHQKKILFLEKDIQKLHQSNLEKQYLINTIETEHSLFKDEIISLKSELANANSIIIQKEKENNSLRDIIEDLKKKNDSKNDDIFIEFPIKPSS